jgi:hypothetical protein
MEQFYMGSVLFKLVCDNYFSGHKLDLGVGWAFLSLDRGGTGGYVQIPHACLSVDHNSEYPKIAFCLLLLA